MKTIHITTEISSAFEAHLNEQIDSLADGRPILRKETFPHNVAAQCSGIVEFAAGWHAALAAKPAQEAMSDEPPIGSYVLATKYGDGDPGDPWAIGFYTRSDPIGSSSRRFYVADSAGNNIRGNGFRRIVGPIRRDVGRWLLEVAARQLEQSPPGAVNLLTMLTANAFDLEQDSERAHGIKKDGTT